MGLPRGVDRGLSPDLPVVNTQRYVVSILPPILSWLKYSLSTWKNPTTLLEIIDNFNLNSNFTLTFLATFSYTYFQRMFHFTFHKVRVSVYPFMRTYACWPSIFPMSFVIRQLPIASCIPCANAI